MVTVSLATKPLAAVPSAYRDAQAVWFALIGVKELLCTETS